MLDEPIKRQLEAHFSNLRRPVELHAALDSSPVAGAIRELLDELAAIDRRIGLREEAQAEWRPSFSVGAAGAPARVRFAGLPTGHEFTSLVLAVLQAGGHPPKADAALLERIRALRGPLRFETFISLSCHNCPDVVQALNLMAALNPDVESVMVDGARFAPEAERRGIMSVPAVFLNGEPFGHGRMSLEEIVAKLDAARVPGGTRRIERAAPYDMLVVGAGPAGASAAIYAARKGIRTGIVAERFGGQVLDTLGIENFVSIERTEGPQLARSLEQHVRQHDVDILQLRRAVRLRPGEPIEVELDDGATLAARSVVLATGARWRELNVPGESTYRNKGVAYCPHCDGPLFKGKRVAVVGGGNSGVEAAIDLAGLARHVTLLEYEPALKADAILQAKLASLDNVAVVTAAAVQELTGDGRRLDGLVYLDRDSTRSHRLEVEGVFVQIGLSPNTEWLRGTVALTSRAEIQIDARGRTSLPGVYAAGDCTDVPFKQIVVSMGAGAAAALGAFEHLVRSPVPA